MSEYIKEKIEIGRTDGSDIMLISSKSRKYICKIRVQQTGGGAIAESMEPIRIANAEHLVKCWNEHEALVEDLADYKEGCEGLKLAVQDIRPYADCYKRVCENLGIEKDILGYVKNLQDCHDDLVAACEDTLIGISEASVEFERKHYKIGQAILAKTFKIVEATLAKAKE